MSRLISSEGRPAWVRLAVPMGTSRRLASVRLSCGVMLVVVFLLQGPAWVGRWPGRTAWLPFALLSGLAVLTLWQGLAILWVDRNGRWPSRSN